MSTSIKSTIKKFIPRFILDWRKKLITLNKPKGYLFKDMSTRDVFDSIYKNNHWKNEESVSGPGSSVENTRFVRQAIEEIIVRHNIKSILDLPCGDFQWMKLVDLHGAAYTGGDIVQELIASDTKKYGNENIQFRTLDLLVDPLPQVDLVICRDCLVHLSNADISRALQNIRSSKSRFLLTTTFNKQERNEDIITGGWRAVNLMISPFNFPASESVHDENPLDTNKYNDKSMALFRIDLL